MSTLPRTTLRQIWWSPLLCFGLAWALSHTETVQQFEWRSLDWRTKFRTHFQKPPDSRIAIVLWDDDTDNRLERWPVDRKWHAQMTQVLALSEAKLIVWDIFFDTARSPEGDTALSQIAKAAGEAGCDFLSAASSSTDPGGGELGTDEPAKPLSQVEGDIGKLVGADHASLPIPELRSVSWFGFADTPPEPDGMRRRIPLVIRVGKEVYPGLALQALLVYFRAKPDDVTVRLGDAVYFPAQGRTVRVPMTEDGRYLLNYRYDNVGSNTDFPVYNYAAMLISLSELHLENKQPQPPPPDLKGKIVFIGETVTGFADAGPSPLRDLTPLTFIQANLVNNVLTDDYARRVPEWIIWGTALALGYLGIALIADRSVAMLCGGAVLGIVSYASLTLWSWVWASWWFPVVGPLGGFISLQFIVVGRRVWQEQKAKLEIKGMFGAYVSPQLVERLVKSGQRPQLGGHLEEITAYFSDIQGFSTFSEQLPADRLVELMNEYLTACTDIVQEEGGTLDKYIGDAVVAMFGAPIALRDHAYRACVASQRVHLKLGELREKWRSEGGKWPQIVGQMQSRIGLNSGRCVIGNMGSRTRFNYTMMGDDVNLAARMESGAKSWGAYTMCTEATKLACEQHGGDRVVFRPLGRIVVKGRAQAAPIYEIVGLKESVAPAVRECIELFTQGLERYYARDWDGALALFRRSAGLEPNIPGQTPGVLSNPSLVYLGIVEHYKIEPPEESWDGVYVMKEK